MKNLSQPTRVYILGVGAVGAAITVGVFFLPAGLRLDLPFLIFLTTALLVQLAGASVVLPGQERHAYSLLTAVLVATVLLFPPANSVLIVLITFIAYWVKRRYPWYQGVFNIFQYVISVAAAEVVWSFFGVKSPIGLDEIRWYLAGFSAGVVFYLVNGLLVTTVISLAANKPFGQVGMISRDSMYREMVLIWLGLMGADFWTTSPLFTVLLGIPLIALSRMLTIHLDRAEHLRISKVEAEERATQLASLNELARTLTSTLEASGIYEALYSQIKRIVPADVFGIGRYNAAEKQIVFEMWRAGDDNRQPFSLSAEVPILKRLLTADGPTILLHPDDAEEIQSLSQYRMLPRDQMVAAVPMTVGDRTMGLIVIGTRTAISPQELDLVTTMASQAGVAMEKAELFKNLQTQMAALEQAQLQLLQSAKLATIGELAAFIAHEINNPLTSVMGYASLILGEMDAGDPRRADLEIIEKEALRARAIVRDLLGYARQTDAVMGPTFVNAALDAVLPLVRQRADGAHVTISTAFEPQLPAIMGDNNQLKQVFINLLNNAIDAMPKGGTVQVETRTVHGNGTGPQVEIAFRDTGVGISPEQLSKIFDPFFTTKKAGQGTGLGLPITKRIVERHGGSIDVISVPGKGTRFTIFLPAITV
ncbi:MAG: ATP-binding protein [bacterium]